MPGNKQKKVSLIKGSIVLNNRNFIIQEMLNTLILVHGIMWHLRVCKKFNLHSRS